MSLPDFFRRSLPAHCLTGLLLVAAVACPAAESTEELPPWRWWVGFQAGPVAMLTKSDPSTDSGATHLLRVLEGGVRIAPHLRLGLQLDSASLGEASCPASAPTCLSRRHGVERSYVTLVTNPGSGSWLYQVSAGQVIYDLEEKPKFFGGYQLVEDIHGWGVRLGIGQDWHRTGARTHLGWRANLEHANPGKLSGGIGSSAFTTINLSLSVGWY